jgi:uncharacterized repeat protein (TIGR01451 family)
MRTQKTRGLRRLGIAVGLVAGAIGLAAAPAMAQVIAPGTLVANKGGYRAVGTNTADGFAKPLANAIFEYSTSSAFPAVPTPFAATDALGVASASVPPATYYVREKTSPANWLSIPTLEWNGSTSAYRSTGTAVASGQSKTAEAAGDSVRFVNERVNPAITTSCRAGLSVLLVMDTSGSTANYRTDYANAANAFVNTLSGTSTSLKISTFATTSKPGVVTYDLATAPGQNAAHAFINGITTSTGADQLTNWDIALQDAAKAKVDVVVFITDGNPTVREGATGTATDALSNVTYGIASANLAKNPDMQDASGDEQRVLGVGVGAGIAVNNLKAISGPTVDKDYAVANTPADLDTLLTQLATTICPADLGITKSGPDTIEPGNIINYDITVKNSGAVTVPFASIKVLDPTATTLTAPTPAPLAPGATLVWKATKNVVNDEKLCNTEVSNTATVELINLPGYNEPDTSNNTSTKTTSVICPLSVSILKTSTSASVAPGGSATYDVTVKNTGNWTVPFNRIVIDDPDAVLTPPVLTTDLAPNATRTWTAAQKVSGNAACGSLASNTASVSLKPLPVITAAAVVDPTTSTATTPVVCPVDFSITKSGDAIVQPNGQISYEILVTNTGNYPVPSGAILVDDPSAPPVTPPVDPPAFLDPGASLTWTATRTAAIDGSPCNASIVNTASVALGDTPGYVWPTGPQQSQFTTQVVCPVDVTVAKTTPSTTVVPGGTVPYTITVTNPSGFAVPFSAISVTDTGATLTPPADTTDLAPGASRIWTATKVADDGTAACDTTVSNTAQVALVNLPAGYSAITPGGSSAAAPGVTIGGGICIVTPATVSDGPIAIAARAQLTVRKSGPAVARRGSGVTYRIRVTNTGPVTATNVVLTDTPPASMLIGGTPTGAMRTGRTLTWAIGDLDAGASRTVTITMGVRLTARGTPCNIASATAANAASATGKACTRVQALRIPVVTG